MSVWYRSGTVALTNGSKTVTGTGTQWSNLIFGVAPGTTFYAPDGKPYEIDRVVSDTSLLLVTNYGGTTASAQAYAIDPTRTGSVASLAAQTSEVLKYSQAQFTQMQTWVTGPANADVTLLSPAGQSVVVPSWKKISDTVTGQAAVAKTEADRAVAAAALATDVVAASALPLPDVWAPLSDSLRMITGYGRDVLVGADVVARMVNFSRNSTATYIGKDGQLKTAAANEPRFEKDGLLLEGQSTNLITGSSVPSSLNGYTLSGTIPSPMSGQDAKVLEYTGTNPANSFIRFNTPAESVATDTKTASCYVMAIGMALAISIECEDAASKTITCPADTWVRISTTRTAPTAAFSNFIDISLQAPVSGQRLAVWGGQLETLPFASSYIPTAGAAVTRAADEWNIPNKINCGPAPAMPMSVAVNFTCMGYVSFNNIFVAGDRQLMVYAGTNKLRVEQGGYSTIDITSNAVGYGGAQNKLRAACSDSRFACLLNGIMTERSGGTPIAGNGFDYFGSSKLRNQFGHIRDLRIWRIALTNEQLKAIA